MNFAGYMAEIILTPEIKKKLFGKPYVTFAGYIASFSTAFASGCALGVILSGRKKAAYGLFCEKGQEEFVLKAFPIEDIASAQGFVRAEQERMTAAVERGTRVATEKLFAHPLLLVTAQTAIPAAFIRGVLFGCVKPSLVEQTWDFGGPKLEEVKQHMKLVLHEWLVKYSPESLAKYRF